MGIRGLRKCLGEKVTAQRCILSRGTTLAIDGDGWMFKLIQLCKDELYMDTGGSYDAYISVVRAEINKLQSFGFNLVVLFDGPKNPLKELVIRERIQQREDEWKSLHEFCTNKSSYRSSFPLAPLCKEQLMATLDACSVRHLQCTYEADQELALFVQQHNLVSTSGARYFAYALDSDYLVMKDCPYIEFDGIEVDGAGNACAHVWSRAELCRVLEISEMQFLDLALFLGNDYTEPLVACSDLYIAKQHAFHGNLDLIVQDWLRRVSNQQTEMLKAVDLFRPSLAHDNLIYQENEKRQIAELQFTMDYSRAFYNLEPLDHFYEHARLTLPPAVPYSSASCVFDFHHYSAASEGKFFADLGRYVKAAEKMGTEGVDRGVAVHALTYLKRKYASSIAATGANPVVTDHHRSALQLMLKRLEHRPSGEIFSSQRGVGESRPLWEDLLAAYVYQKTCALMLKYFPDDAFVGEHNTPVKIFDAELFHSILAEVKRSENVPVHPVTNLPTSEPFPIAVSIGEASSGLPPVSRSVERSPERNSETRESQKTGAVEPPLARPSSYKKLPIDAHREAILHHIHHHRVTIIHGETGCGKSSRLPQFLLEDAEALRHHCHIFVAQPRRIGVVGMLKRLRPVLGDKVGMRMGHGVRDEAAETKLYYVTTGYLVQLVAHHPEALKRCTHIVIDEVHERSVDGDLICLLVRDLLLDFPHLRVVLMSATINTDLYQEYFSQCDDGSFGTIDCLSVGAKLYPLQIKYIEDLLTGGQRSHGSAIDVQKLARRVSDEGPLSPPWVEAQHGLVVALLRTVCKTGSTVLVFISGMDDITNIATLLEPYLQFLVCPLHSNTPEEEQDLIFEPTPPGNIKVVLATNMAESSVTIPDCDVVICLGTHKAVTFSESLQRTHVAFGLLSKASATQRAGRTGRVRPGTVYRLYTKETYQKMREHELAEVLRRPLEDVVLNMWAVLENAQDFQGVTPFLHRLIEVPNVRYIDKSYEKLFEASLITFPSDDGNLTPAGRFVSALPLDLSLGRMLSYGVLLGVSAEAVVMVAALSLSRSPYRIANAIFLDPEQYNCQLRQRFLSEVHYDEGVYSEPIALLRLLCDWRSLSSGKARYSFCHKNNLQISVMKQFDSTAKNLATELVHLQSRTCDNSACVNFAVGTLSNITITILRLIMVWSFSDNILLLQKSDKTLKALSSQNGTLLLKSDRVTERHMRYLFGSIPHALHAPRSSQANGSFFVSHAICFAETDPLIRLIRLVDNLAGVGRFSSAPCFAVVTESHDEEFNHVVFVVLPGRSHQNLIHQFCACMRYNTAYNEDYLARQLSLDCPYIAHYGDVSVFTCEDVNQLDVENLHKMLLSVPNALVVTLCVEGSACLQSVSTALDPKSVALIFGVVVANKKDRKPFVMSAVSNSTTLNFPQEEQDNASGSLIRDLPLGHRFVQCCRASRKSMKLVLKLQASEVADDDLVEAELVGPYKANRAEKVPQLEVEVAQVVEPTWQYRYNGSNFPAKLARQSMMSASFHCGTESLYAVAHTALPVTKSDGTSFVVGGVSFLPTHQTWLALALRATGKELMCGSQMEKDTLHPPQYLMKLASNIRNDVQNACEFVRRDDIIMKVNALFAPCTRNFETNNTATKLTEDTQFFATASAASSDCVASSERQSMNQKSNVQPKPVSKQVCPGVGKKETKKVKETKRVKEAKVPTNRKDNSARPKVPYGGEKARKGSKTSTTNPLQLYSDPKAPPKVVSLPPSVPKVIIAPRLTIKDAKINRTHGYEQAEAYKMAHEARKLAAASSAIS